MSYHLFTSESVAEGHPDKVADQISDAILDHCLKSDPHSRVASETLVTSGLLALSGEITSRAAPIYKEIAMKTMRDIGYTDFKPKDVVVTIHHQSPQIAAAIGDDEGAGDQGLMFGYACRDTPELMPMPIAVAHRIMRKMKVLRESKALSYLGPDGKCQVTVEYDEYEKPRRIDTVVISKQHAEDVDLKLMEKDLKKLVNDVTPKGLLDEKTLFYINPGGAFSMGGPEWDTGLTGRKIIVDTYGGMGHHGGGSFSGKDATKVDRTGAYAARYIAKNIVAAGLADRCEVQISYAIGLSQPISVYVNTFGTERVQSSKIEQLIPKIFDLSPKGMIEMLDLRRPIYHLTAFGGHFGREEKEFTWEKTDKSLELSKSLLI